MSTLDFDTLNTLPDGDFVALLSGAFGSAKWVAEHALSGRPYASVRQLHQAMAKGLSDATRRQRQDLLLAQKSLDRHRPFRKTLQPDFSSQELESFGTSLSVYEQRFGFAFVMAIDGHTKDEVIAELAQRLTRDKSSEETENLRQISEIARNRLEQMFHAKPLGDA